MPLARPSLGIEPATQACALSENQTSDLLAHGLTLTTEHTSWVETSFKSTFGPLSTVAIGGHKYANQT